MDILSSISNSPSLPLLFILSFLAATVLPLGSEWLLVVMLAQDFPPEKTVLVASLGNYLGACTTFAIGLWGSEFVIEKILRIDARQRQRSEKLFTRYGSWALLLSWLPIVGDPLCLLAGVFRTGFLRFSLLVFTGKLARYTTLAVLARQGMEYIGG
jgi:membrane protein YqaA with SNARE-associated domain